MPRGLNDAVRHLSKSKLIDNPYPSKKLNINELQDKFSSYKVGDISLMRRAEFDNFLSHYSENELVVWKNHMKGAIL